MAAQKDVLEFVDRDGADNAVRVNDHYLGSIRGCLRLRGGVRIRVEICRRKQARIANGTEFGKLERAWCASRKQDASR